MLINLITTSTSSLSAETQEKIKLLINVEFQKGGKNYLICYWDQLIEEVKKLYIRACHQF